MNKVILSGRIVKDPELKNSASRLEYCLNSLAIQEHTKEGKKTTFVNISLFGKTAIVFSQYVKKGSMILVEGKISVSQTKKENITTTYTNVVCDKVEFLSTPQKEAQVYNPAPIQYKALEQQEPINVDDDAILFED